MSLTYAGVLNDDEYEYDVADTFLENLGEAITRALSEERAAHAVQQQQLHALHARR
jgi:hypothetical protein